MLTWLKEKYNAEIIAFCADIGQEEELRGLSKKARGTGASDVYIDDLQEEFARDFIFPMMQVPVICFLFLYYQEPREAANWCNENISVAAQDLLDQT